MLDKKIDLDSDANDDILLFRNLEIDTRVAHDCDYFANVRVRLVPNTAHELTNIRTKVFSKKPNGKATSFELFFIFVEVFI